MRSTTLPPRLHRTGCSVLALATVLVVGATPASAQSFLGTGSFTHNGGGSASITTAPNVTNINLNAGQTVIDWVPTDNAIANNTAIAFQNSGTTATFAGTGNFAVLNRINPADSTRMISMNGTIQTSSLGFPAASNGSIYFYTPGGFVIGANAVINVGSLVLSASPITVDGSGNFITGFGTTNSVIFGQAGQAGAMIATNSGAQINAFGTDAYVAMVAPRVQHNGIATVAGSAALVAAEAATISFSPDGLFDIQVTAGTTDNEGLEVNGTITGSAGGPGDHHRAYLVAVPKNSLLTMAIGSGANLGFAVADSADVVGNTVVLSAGHDISNGSIAGVSAGSTGAGAIANLDVRDSVFTSAMIGEATGTAFLSGYGTLKFHSDVTVHADGEVWLSTQLPGGSVDIDGNLTLSTQQFGANGEDVTSSPVQIFNLNGGDINVDGLTSIDTDAWGGWSGTTGINGGDAIAGNVNINANPGGSISLLGGLNVSANGVAGGAFGAGVDGGVGTGGQVLLRTAGAGSVLTVANGVGITANGYGGSGAGGECFACDGDGGTGQGGDIRIVGQSGVGSTLTINGNVSAVADGFGGAGGVGATAGNGRGGAAAYFVGTGNVMTLTGNLLLQAEGTGGNHSTGDGGIGTGGRADITEEVGATSGTIVITGNVELSTDGEGGDAFGAIGDGGDGVGGDGFDGTYIFAEDASITINGSTNLHSTGTGGSSANGTGGFGYGGNSRLVSHGLLTITGNADVTSVGVGGNGATGGDAFGGLVNVRAVVGGDLNLLGESNLFSANGIGGAGTNGVGGIAHNTGDMLIYADGAGSIVTISGDTTATASATGGASATGTGGDGYGGDVDVFVQNGGSLDFGADLTARADGRGGDGNALGGYGEGGTLSLYSRADLTIGGALIGTARGFGGDTFNGAAGSGDGGIVDIYAENGALTAVGPTVFSTIGAGGTANQSGNSAGDGQGGQTNVTARIGGTLDFQDALTVAANGVGGDNFSGVTGGDGNGGDVRVQATAADATITVGGNALLVANGFASPSGGGIGTGGTVWADAFGAATARLDFQADLSLFARGWGGDDGGAGAGGDGFGGQALLQASAGSTVSVGGNALVNTDAFGGYSYDFSDGVGGNATGGTSRIQAFGGGTIAIDGSANVSAIGNGGDSYSFIGGQAGDGTGGTAQLYATDGIVTIGNIETGGDATVSADGYGGYSSNGDGGDGTGGALAEIAAVNGDITIEGFAGVSASGFGGDGLYGGNGLGSGDTSAPDVVDWTGGAHIFAQNGDIVINGGAQVSATGSGGDGGSNNGYSGDYGGDGGNGTGGWATIFAFNSNLGSSLIDISGGFSETSGDAFVDVGGSGGDGGNGFGGNAGGDGGNGGIGRGGIGSITASAGNGTVRIGSASVWASGEGGSGGNGGNGDGEPGGNGGDGGDAFGGYGTVGTQSGNGQSAAVNNGLGDYGAVYIDASATGGDGGDGNFGFTSGTGGDGGDAVGGAALLLVRGSTVEADFVSLNANADGGWGGSGDGETSLDGNGGNATVGGDGGIGVVASDRYLIPAHRGTLNAGAIVGTAIATEGLGNINGTSQNLGSSAVSFLNADGNIGSLDFEIYADNQGAGAVNESISIINGDVMVDGAFSFATSGNLSLFANNGDMHAGALNLSAGNFVFDPVNDPPTDRGTYFADSATITTGNNFVTSADLVIGSSLVINAPGLINAHNFGIDGDLDLIAQSGGITANDLDVTGDANLDAFGAIDLNLVQAGFFRGDAGGTFTSSDITSDSDIRIGAGDDVTLGNLIAGTSSIGSSKAVRIDTDGSVLVGNILAAGGIDVTADGSVTGGNVTTGDVLITEAGGAIVYQNISAGLVNPQIPSEPFSVALDSSTSINVGNVDATQAIGFITLGTLTTRYLTTNSDILGLVHGNINIGDIDADGRVQLADSAMFTNAGGAIGNQGDDDIDIESIFAAALVPTNGSVSLGSVLAGSLEVAAGTSINVGSIEAIGAVSLFAGTSYISGDIVDAGSIYAESGSDIFLGNLTAPGDIELIAASDILIGNAVAGESIDLDAGGYVDGGTMTAGDSLYVGAGSYVDLLNISAGLVDQSSDVDADFNVGILAGTTIDTGDIEAFNSIGLGAAGNITTGSIDAGNIFLALGGGDMSFGPINSGGPTYLADDSMIPLGGDLTEELGFDPAPILAATPVASGGSIELRGAVVAGNFQAAAGTTLTGLAINSGNQIYATSGGNMNLGNLFANNDVRLTSSANIVTGSIDSGDDVALVAAGSISTLDIFAYDDVSADAGTTITTDDITGNSIDLFADGSIDTGDLLTQNFFFGAGQLVTGSSITVQSGGEVDTGTIDALLGVHVSADGSINTGTIDADTFVQLFAGGNITAGNINAGSFIDVFSSNSGQLNLANLTAGTQIDLESDGSLDFGDASADDFNFEMGGAVNGGNIDAITHADGHADGAIVLENITVTGPPSDGDFSIGFSSATSITVENVDGFGRVGFATLGDLTTGNITAGSLAMTLVSGDTVTGSIATDGDGQVYMADASMFETGGGLEEDGDFDASIVLALAPVPTGGSITINGAVTTGLFQAAAGDDLSARAITADAIEASASDNATIDGIWSASDVLLASGDINITTNGRIDAGTEGLITLNAVRTDGGALIGDGLTGTGYALSNAEFARISGGTIRIVVGGNGGDADTLIGDLTITGPLAGSNIESSDGGVEFITLQEDGAALDGTLRVVGDVTVTGFGPENYLGFYTQNFELDAATGSIVLTGSGGALAGTLELYASRIHVAEAGLLDQLAANPQFAGYREALNQPAAVARPGGVINAANFDIEFGGADIEGPYTLFVQNMGSATVPAGFLLSAANIADDGEGDLPPGSIDMAINGQIIAEGGTLTGIAVRDLLVTEFGTDIFVAGSTINGCPLIGACITAPPPRIDTIVRTDVQINDSSGLGDGVDGSLSNPPNPLLDTDFLGQSTDVDDPVSGAGNPSLIGTSEDDVETCDNTKDNNCKTDKKGDGK